MKIYMTRYNSDMTEGRGHMVNDIAFLHKAHAETYIDSKLGIMGRKAPWSRHPGGDWDIVEIEVLEGPYTKEYDLVKIRQRALLKLTDKEKEALGLI